MHRTEILVILNSLLISTISVIAQGHREERINISHALEQYIAVCGHEFLCHKESIPSELKSNRQYNTFIKCPKCSCDSTCLHYRKCCPDLYLSFPTMHCESVDLPGFPLANTSYLLVDDCPIKTPDSQRDGCKGTNQSLVDKLLLPPVTSTGEFRITKNKICAECNEFYTCTTWVMKITCLDFADFNYLSSYEDILTLAEDRRCGISYVPPDEKDAIQCNKTDKSKTYIDACNINAFLDIHDDDIKAMCDSDYELQFVLPDHSSVSFKNIFCFMCNLSYSDADIVSYCNISSKQEENDLAVERSCERYPLTPVTYPFKNVFCYLCNRNTNLTSIFTDGNVTISHCSSTGIFPYEYKISIDKLNADYLLQYMDFLKTNIDISEDHLNISRDMYASYELTNNIILTNALQKIYAFQNASFCDRKCNSFLQSNDSFCNCKIQDIQCMKKCCFDFACVYPASCYPFERPHGVFPVSPSNVFIVDGCFAATTLDELAIFKYLCEMRHLPDSIFISFPVMYNGFSTSYLNTFCALCNEKREQQNVKDSIHSLLFYDLRFRCPYYIPFNYHTSLTSIIEVARKLKCD